VFFITERMSKGYFVFVIFCVTLILLFAVYLRSERNRIFYKYSICKSEQSRLKQQLGKKQLQLEGIINPAAISGSLEESGDE
jgi:hypothetical protein